MPIIIILGLFLRLTFINKLEGLWNDEYVSWMVAATPFGNGFWTEVMKQCHMPLYYLYLKPFATFSDVILRLTSVIPGIISIYTMYLVGKEYSKKVGIYSALITSILSFLIYYSQEVRFYSLLFLLSSLSLLFTIRLLKNNNKTNLIGYTISLILVTFTHVLGIIYSFFNILYVLYKNRIFNKKILGIILSIFVIITPIGIHILKMLPSSQWWGHFSYTNILFLFTDYFSPILTNNVNAPPVFFYNKDIALWLVVPTLVSIIGLACGIKKNKGIICIAILNVLILAALSLLGKLVFITKYSIEILPILIVVTACGFEKLKKIGLVLITIFVLLHLSSFFTPHYVTKTIRKEGHKIVGDILTYRNPQSIIFTYYEPNRFERYTKLSNKNTKYISKINRFEYVNNPDKILLDIKKDEKVSFVFLDSVSFFPDEYIKMYTNLPEMFVTFSKIKNSLVQTIDKDYKNYTVDTVGAWTVVTAIKK